MRKFARRLAIGVGSYLVLALLFDAFIGASQIAIEPGRAEGVLRTYDEEGRARESRMIVIDDEADGTVWVQSGHHFRGWYHRLIRNPRVELVRGEETIPYTAVALETASAKARIRRLLIERVGLPGYYFVRAVLLFADVKPVRLDPR